jgi:hypothetical protein
MSVMDTVHEINQDMKEISQDGVALESGKFVRHYTKWQRRSTNTYVEYTSTVRIMVDMFFSLGLKESTEETSRVWNTDRREPFFYHTGDTEEDEIPWDPDFSIYKSESDINDSDDVSISSKDDEELCDLAERTLEHEMVQKAKESGAKRSKSA